MEDKLFWFKAVAGLVGGSIVGFLGGWDTALMVLVIFVVLDYVTGVVAAFYNKSLDSNIGFKGIVQKVLIFVVVAVGYWLDVLLGEQVLRSVVIFFYIANEALSIIENLGQAGVPVPDALKGAVEKLKDRR